MKHARTLLYRGFAHRDYVLSSVCNSLLLSAFVATASFFTTESVIAATICTLVVCAFSLFIYWKRAPHLFALIHITERGIKVKGRLTPWESISSVALSEETITYRVKGSILMQYPLGQMYKLTIQDRQSEIIWIKGESKIGSLLSRNFPKQNIPSVTPSRTTKKPLLPILFGIILVVNVILGVWHVSLLRFTVPISCLLIWAYRQFCDYIRYRYR